MSKLPKIEIFELVFFVVALVFFFLSVLYDSWILGTLMGLFASIGFIFALISEKRNPRGW